jgi:hypothetical protein
MQPGDLIVVSLLEELPVGSQFANWPLHVTVAAWSRGKDPDHLQRDLETHFKNFQPFTATVGPETRFTIKGSVLVNEIVLPSPFEELHQATKAALTANDFNFVGDVFPKYRPHVTVLPQTRARAGDRFTCDRLYVVRKQADHREIIKIIPLHHETTT